MRNGPTRSRIFRWLWLGGKEYGSGSSRDWAAKRTSLWESKQ